MDGFSMDGDGGFELDGEPVDLNGDGSADALASAADLDGDGVADSVLYEVPVDIDDDGGIDGVTTLVDVGGDDTVDAIMVDQAVDTNSDGQFDAVVHAVDSDGDGSFDDQSVDELAQPASMIAGAGPDAEEVDLDGDGAAESATLEIRDGDVTTTLVDEGGDGTVDAIVAHEATDTDGDGVVDEETYSVDSDADGQIDQTVVERQADTDGDGRVDAWSTAVDSDGDGKVDSVVIRHAVDSDGDGTLDTEQTLVDSDGDGQIDDADLDGDGQFEASGAQHDATPAAEDAYPDHANFDPATAGDDVVGDPGADMEHWHEQANPDTCAVVSQEYMLESLTGQDFDEEELRQEAIDNGWYTPGAGTPLGQMGAILEAHGIPVEREYGGTVDDIESTLEHGGKVMVAIDADETWNAGKDDVNDDLLGDAGGIPGQDANHAVEVIGVDRSDPEHPMVILNDPGHPDGRGMMVPLDEFQDAWDDSGCYMVSTK